jgi:hypothetical protein
MNKIELCGYELDEMEGCYHSCELPKGHRGLHKAMVSWGTEKAEICERRGHKWSEWELIGETNAFTYSDYKTKPFEKRSCSRCKQTIHRDEDGKICRSIMAEYLLAEMVHQSEVLSFDRPFVYSNPIAKWVEDKIHE